MTEKHKILVAEDEEYNFTLLKLLFEKEGVDVIRASNGAEAIDLFSSMNDIKLILMDIKMPVMNGLEATRRIKKMNKSIPVLAVTAYVMREEQEACLKAGCDDIITKPIDRERLMSTAFHMMEG